MNKTALFLQVILKINAAMQSYSGRLNITYFVVIVRLKQVQHNGFSI